MAQLERSYQALKLENAQLVKRVDALQRQIDEQNGQLKVLMTFVQTSLKERVEMSAENSGPVQGRIDCTSIRTA